jgi:hypothetical protein
VAALYGTGSQLMAIHFHYHIPQEYSKKEVVLFKSTSFLQSVSAGTYIIGPNSSYLRCYIEMPLCHRLFLINGKEFNIFK